MTEDWTTIVPKPEDVYDTAVQLLKLATDPAHVRTDGNGNEFRVPPYLADLFTAPPKPRRRTKKEEGDE